MADTIVIENFDKQKLAIAYSIQKSSARKRQIEWLFTFEEWIGVWNNSGMLSLRGKGKGCFMMCRKVEPGPYSLENVYIGTSKQNQQDLRRKGPLKNYGCCVGYKKIRKFNV